MHSVAPTKEGIDNRPRMSVDRMVDNGEIRMVRGKTAGKYLSDA
jgi:hypothetical protein